MEIVALIFKWFLVTLCVFEVMMKVSRARHEPENAGTLAGVGVFMTCLAFGIAILL